MNTTNAFRELFLIDPTVTFLNHGSFGATPRPVFEAYQEWQRKLEWQPVQFTSRDLPNYLQDARQKLGQYINAHHNDIVYIPNATYGVNVVARSLPLREGDEVLTTDHEYGACNHTWQFLSQKKGFTYIQQPIPLPVTDNQTIIDQFWQGVTPRTKVIYISHITSATALCFPVAEICKRARKEGIITLVDGAHALGQIPLDMQTIGADFYTSNAHKWLCSPKGSAFLYARPEKQHLIEPIIVSWGWGDTRTQHSGSDFIDFLQWVGTNDSAAYLSVPAAIQFQEEHNWEKVRQDCHELVKQAMHRICDLTGLAPLYPDDAGFYHQLAIAPLPPVTDLQALKAALYDEYRVEIPLTQLQNKQFIRTSIQAYNTQEDVDTLLKALTDLLPQFVA